ncbi:hypothetical protein MHH28_28375 [Paenibacillus sp. FSL K6-1217]|uniref:hypothetical protein n=1 Tax=Paenibacillus sp. FSL K6-1217 TaxID=2921466 RepID=UPI00325150E6
MKTQIRNLTIQDQPFVYWLVGGPRFTLNISPKEDKTTKITLIFEAAPPEEEHHTFWEFYDISAYKDNYHIIIHLGNPRHISEIILYLQQEKPELWLKGKHHTIENAWELLQAMGYSDMEPIWIKHW